MVTPLPLLRYYPLDTVRRTIGGGPVTTGMSLSTSVLRTRNLGRPRGPVRRREEPRQKRRLLLQPKIVNKDWDCVTNLGPLRSGVLRSFLQDLPEADKATLSDTTKKGVDSNFRKIKKPQFCRKFFYFTTKFFFLCVYTSTPFYFINY